MRNLDLAGKDLRGADLRDAYLRDAFLIGANLTNTIMPENWKEIVKAY